MIKNPLNVLVLDGTMYDIAKVKNATGIVVEIDRAELNTDINCSEIEFGLHALVIERAAEGQVQKLGENAQLYEPSKDDHVVAIKYKRSFLLLLGHQRVEGGISAKVKVFLTSTVALKNARAKIDTTAPAAAAKPIPAPSHPSEFRNAPRIVTANSTAHVRIEPRKEPWGGEKKVKHYGGRPRNGLVGKS